MPRIRQGKKFTAVGVYTSAGGFSRGIQDGGGAILAHLHDGVFGYETLIANFPEVPTWTDFDEWPLDRLAVMEPDVIFCAPPCAPWSGAGGQGKLLNSDPRVAKVGHALTVGFRTSPAIWVMESVPGFPKKSPEMVKEMADAWMGNGYAVTLFYSNYLLHDTPQNRNRFHFIAHRIPLADPLKVLGGFPEHLPVIRDYLPSPKQSRDELIIDNTYRKLDPIIREYLEPGQNLRKLMRDLIGLQRGESGGPSFGYYRLREDYPAATMLSNPRVIHPNGRRLINVREGMALAGYPPDFKILGPDEVRRYRAIGKGVLPKMGEFLGRWFTASLKNTKSPPAIQVTTVDWREEGRRLLRQRPPANRIPADLYGTRPDLRTWRQDWNPDDDDEAEDDE